MKATTSGSAMNVVGLEAVAALYSRGGWGSSMHNTSAAHRRMYKITCTCGAQPLSGLLLVLSHCCVWGRWCGLNIDCLGLGSVGTALLFSSLPQACYLIGIGSWGRFFVTGQNCRRTTHQKTSMHIRAVWLVSSSVFTHMSIDANNVVQSDTAVLCRGQELATCIAICAVPLVPDASHGQSIGPQGAVFLLCCIQIHDSTGMRFMSEE